MLQGAASFLPVMALAPQENERILDLCAAPGGKTTHIGALLRNTGVLFANDVNGDRTSAVIGNLHRLGIVNSVVTCVDGRKYPQMITGFDRVLVDAPCTGTGVTSRDPSVKISKDEKDVQRMSKLQRELLAAAIDCCKVGGVVVYSTCSILVEENEAVINYALKKRHVKVVEAGVPTGKEGIPNYRSHVYHPSIKLARRIYPHVHNMDGFFLCKLRKTGNGIRLVPEENGEKAEAEKTGDRADEIGEEIESPTTNGSAEKKGKVAKKSQSKTKVSASTEEIGKSAMVKSQPSASKEKSAKDGEVNGVDKKVKRAAKKMYKKEKAKLNAKQKIKKRPKKK